MIANIRVINFLMKMENTMKINKILGAASLIFAFVAVAGCQSIPPEQLKNYALIESHIRDGSGVAYISYQNGRSLFPAKPSIDVLPGEYQFQVGLGCSNTTTCRRGSPINLVVVAGKRYALESGRVMVSDRFADRKNEVPYQ